MPFPKLVEIHAECDEKEMAEVAKILSETCSAIQKNIATKINMEPLYSIRGGKYLLAGSGSVQVCLGNFFKRFTELLYNLHWILGHQRDEATFEQVRDEAEFYLDVYDQLLNRYEGLQLPWLNLPIDVATDLRKELRQT